MDRDRPLPVRTSEDEFIGDAVAVAVARARKKDASVGLRTGMATRQARRALAQLRETGYDPLSEAPAFAEEAVVSYVVAVLLANAPMSDRDFIVAHNAWLVKAAGAHHDHLEERGESLAQIDRKRDYIRNPGSYDEVPGSERFEETDYTNTPGSLDFYPPDEGHH